MYAAWLGGSRPAALAFAVLLILGGCTGANPSYNPACPGCPAPDDMSAPGSEDLASPPGSDLTSPPGSDMTTLPPDMATRTRQISVSIPGRLQPFCIALAGTAVTRVVSDPAGIDCGMGAASCSATFPSNVAVTLRSMSNAAVSLRFSGGCTASAPPCVVAAGNAAAAVNVNVDLVSLLTLKPGTNNNSNGILASPVGDPNGNFSAIMAGFCPARTADGCCALYPPGTKVTLTSQSNMTGGNNGNCSGNKFCTVTINGQISATTP